jgi:hypothetical protein
MKIYIILDSKNNSIGTKFYLAEDEKKGKFLKYKGEVNIELSSNGEDSFKEILEIKEYLKRELEKDYGIEYCILSNSQYISKDIIGYFHQIFAHSGNLAPIKKEYSSKIEILDLGNIKNTFQVLKNIEVNNLLLYTEKEIEEINKNFQKDEGKKYLQEIEKLKNEILELKKELIRMECIKNDLEEDLKFLKNKK